MINNRQAGRRNRGRNNGRPNNGNRGGGDNGNRIDSRARGNAAQLLEKYKNMARDAQMAGDRVNAEYYLQFADHYFRVLADNRARQEEQQQRFRRYDENFDDDGEDVDVGDEGEGAHVEQPNERADQPHHRRRDGRDERRDDREGRERRDRNVRERPAAAETPEQPLPAQDVSPAGVTAPEPQPETEAPRPRRGRPRKADAAKAAEEKAEGLDIAVLPPSIARADNDSEAPEDEAPRKRTRRPRAATQAAE